MNNKIVFYTLINSLIVSNTRTRMNNIQFGGSKQISILHNNHKYIFETNYLDDNYYVMYSQDKSDDVYVSIVIDKENKIAEIHNISTENKSCLPLSNEKYGSTLLQIAIKLLQKYKSNFNINTITLKDNSIKNCGNNNIKFDLMSILLTGQTWYGKYGFRPVHFSNKKIILDEQSNEKYNKNYNKINKITLGEIDLIRVFRKAKLDEILINETEKIIKKNPSMLVKDFLTKFIKDFDKTFLIFYKFYEILYEHLHLKYITNKFYGLNM